jgi:NAD(P)-dependent dehydrogenase (short-subunit alcohol dehydrogenase family)
LHGDGLAPENALRDLNMDNFERIFAVNTFGPALVAKHFLPLIPKDTKSVFAALSARVGSISDNRLGGWHAYRASKTALNMIIKNSAIETARRYKRSCVIGLHPGTVDTGLSEPFQGGVPPDKLFTPDQSAAYLMDVIDTITPEYSGSIFDWKGEIIKP